MAVPPKKGRRALKYALAFVACLALGTIAVSQMLFRRDDLWVYPRGRITLAGSTQERQNFVFWNPTSRTLTLLATPMCSCTAIDFPTKVAPFSFATGTLEVDFSGQPPGRARKDFEIALSDGKEGSLLYVPLTIDHQLGKKP